MHKTQPISIAKLWASAPSSDRVFDPESSIDLPTVARRYLVSAISPRTKLATAVRLWMHGNIKLGGKWYPFQGEEVICWNRGMIWRATTWMNGLPIWARSIELSIVKCK